MSLLGDLFGLDYVDPRLALDSQDATTGDVRARMPAREATGHPAETLRRAWGNDPQIARAAGLDETMIGKLWPEQPAGAPSALGEFLASDAGQKILLAMTMVGGPKGAMPQARPLVGPRPAVRTAEPMPVSNAEMMAPGDATRYPVHAPGKVTGAELAAAREAHAAMAREAGDAIAQQLGPQYQSAISPQREGSAYLRIMRAGEDPAAAPVDTGFKARFSNHAPTKPHSISVDPASGNTVADVVAAYRHHVGVDRNPPEVGWSWLQRETQTQHGGRALYHRDILSKDGNPLEYLNQLFAPGGMLALGRVAGGSQGDGRK